MLAGDCRRYKDQINKFGVGLVHDKTVSGCVGSVLAYFVKGCEGGEKSKVAFLTSVIPSLCQK